MSVTCTQRASIHICCLSPDPARLVFPTGLMRMQAEVHPGFALPLQLHRKGGLEAVILRALPEFGASKREAYRFVSVR